MGNLFIPKDINEYINHLQNNLNSNQIRIEYINNLLEYGINNIIADGILTNGMMEMDKYYYQAIEDGKLKKTYPMFNFVNTSLIQRYANSLDGKDKIDYLEFVIKEFEKRNVGFGYDKFNKEIIEFKLELDYHKNKNSKTIEIEELLTKETFLKYVDKFEWGFIPDSFNSELENIKSIKNKIIFINYIENQLKEYINYKGFLLDMQKSKIDNYYKKQKYYDDIINKERAKIIEERKAKRNNIKFKDNFKNNIKFRQSIKELDERINNKSNYQYLIDNKVWLEERIDGLEDSLNYIKEIQDFWNEQLRIDNNKLDNINTNNTINSFQISKKGIVKNENKIQWQSNDSDLYYLIKTIQFNPVQKQIFKDFINNNFVDNTENKKPFSEKNIQQGINNLLDNKKSNNKSKKGYLIDGIIKKSLSKKVVNIDLLIKNLSENNFIKSEDINKFSTLKQKLNLP